VGDIDKERWRTRSYKACLRDVEGVVPGVSVLDPVWCFGVEGTEESLKGDVFEDDGVWGRDIFIGCSRREGVCGNKIELFLNGDLEGDSVVIVGIANSRIDFLVGDREGEDGGAGNLIEVTAEGEQEARVRVKAEALGPESSGKSASGMFGTEGASQWSYIVWKLEGRLSREA
jgi:hypothetical protein